MKSISLIWYGCWMTLESAWHRLKSANSSLFSSVMSLLAGCSVFSWSQRNHSGRYHMRCLVVFHMISSCFIRTKKYSRSDSKAFGKKWQEHIEIIEPTFKTTDETYLKMSEGNMTKTRFNGPPSLVKNLQASGLKWHDSSESRHLWRTPWHISRYFNMLCLNARNTIRF